jgi:hypothetical protein
MFLNEQLNNLNVRNKTVNFCIHTICSKTNTLPFDNKSLLFSPSYYHFLHCLITYGPVSTSHFVMHMVSGGDAFMQQSTGHQVEAGAHGPQQHGIHELELLRHQM